MLDIYNSVYSSMCEAIEWTLTHCEDDEREDLFADADNVRDYMSDNGRLYEVLDGCVPIYTRDIVETWLALNMPESEEFGGYAGDDVDIITQMNCGIYYAIDDYAVRCFADCYADVVGKLTNR